MSSPPDVNIGVAPAVARSQHGVQRSTLVKNLNIIRALAVADFRLKYHNSALGYLWSMLNPLLMFTVYYFVFTQIFKSTIPDYPLFLLAGIISYSFFQDCTFSAMNSLGGKSSIMKKIYFPRSIIIFASSVTCVFSYLINFAILMVLVGSVKGFGPLVLLVPIPIFCVVIFSVGVAFLLATVYAHFRDMSQIWAVVVLAMFWVTPIVFNAETLPEPVSTLVYFNPLTRIIGMVRHYLLYDYFDLRFLMMTSLYSGLSFLAGYLIFRKNESKLPELF